MKETSLLVHVIASAYFMGEAFIQHPSAQQLLRDSDSGFKNLITNLKQRKCLNSVYFLTRIFGLVAGTSFITFILVALLPLEGARSIGQPLLLLCALSAASWASLGWVFHHRRVMREYLGWLGFFGFGSVLMPLMDVLTDAGITPLVFSQLAHGFGWLFPGLADVDSLFYQGVVIVGFYVGFLLLVYMVAWIYAVPLAVVGWGFIALPLAAVRLIDRIFPVRPLAAIMFLAWLMTLVHLAYGS